jgi:hypothetical protein
MLVLSIFANFNFENNKTKAGIIKILKIAEPQIVQIPTSSPFSFNIINHTKAVKNSGKEELIASKVAHLTCQGIFNFFQIKDNCSSRSQVA